MDIFFGVWGDLWAFYCLPQMVSKNDFVIYIAFSLRVGRNYALHPR